MDWTVGWFLGMVMGVSGLDAAKFPGKHGVRAVTRVAFKERERERETTLST